MGCRIMFITLPSVALADIGLPMIVLTFPPMLMALVPIIVLESFLLAKFLSLTFKTAMPPSAVANALSTAVGFPLAWFLMLALQFLTPGGGSALGMQSVWQKLIAVTLQAAWLIPYEKELWWMIPSAAAFGLIPAYFISVALEFWVARKFLPQTSRSVLLAAVAKANLASYALLALLCAAVFLRQFQALPGSAP